MDDPVSIIIVRVVRLGQEKAFEAAVEQWIPHALQFPGYLGVHMLRPPPGGHEYGAVLKFSDRAHWNAFQHSEEYTHFLRSIHPLLQDTPSVQTLSGLESWFTPNGANTLSAPPRWKMALVTWLGVCLAVFTVQELLSPWTRSLPFIISFVVLNGLIVALLTWIVMPALSRLFRPWLMSQQSHP